jgi:hypothetical protein
MRPDQANEVAKQLVQFYRSTYLGIRHSVASICRLQRVCTMCTSKVIKFKVAQGLYVHSVYHTHTHFTITKINWLTMFKFKPLKTKLV